MGTQREQMPDDSVEENTFAKTNNQTMKKEKAETECDTGSRLPLLAEKFQPISAGTLIKAKRE